MFTATVEEPASRTHPAQTNNPPQRKLVSVGPRQPSDIPDFNMRKLEAFGDAVLAITELQASHSARLPDVVRMVVEHARKLTDAEFGAFCPDVGLEARPLTAFGALNHICVDVGLHDRRIGTLHLAKRADTEPFSEEDERLLVRFARHAAIALENATLYDQMQTTVQASSELLAIVSHDLRNPLNAIALREQLLLQDSVDETVAQHVASVRRSVGAMDRLIKGLLDVAKIDAGKLTLDLAPFDFASVVDEVIETLAPLARARGIRIDATFESLASCHADRDRVLQVLSNLVGNAVSFSPDGGVVSVRAKICDGELCVRVCDQGPGIAADALPRIFDRYFSARHGQKSTGLGLHIAKKFVDAHGGCIWAESTVDQGSTFSFRLPKERP